MQKSFVFDLNKCTGCQACQVACLIENEGDPALSWRKIYNYNEQRLPDKPFYHLSLACNHCIDAPCMKYCPALAYQRDPEFGAVVIYPDKCIGCRYCSWVCPYDAPKFNELKGTIEKCDFCVSRLSDGLNPACVTLCPTDALTTSDYPENLQNEIIAGFPEVEIHPAIQMIPLKKGQTQPQTAEAPLAAELLPLLESLPAGNHQSKIQISNEWTLMLFSFLSTVLAGIAGASLISSFKINILLFAVLALTNMVISTIHLGNKRKSYRAILNWRSSWLSREIIFYGLFSTLSLLHFVFADLTNVFSWPAGLCAILTLIAIDKVYDCAQTMNSIKFHSARTLITGLLFGVLFAGQFLFAALILTIKMIFYLFRKFKRVKNANSFEIIRSSSRVILGFIIPILLSLGLTSYSEWLILTVVLAEFIDRLEFYLELSIITPLTEIKD